jgi:hypothetical protein
MPMTRETGLGVRLPRMAAALGLALALAGCGVGRGFSGSGDGFGGFGVRPLPVPPEEADGYTMRRLRGQPDEAVALQPDFSIQWPYTAEDTRTSVFETEEERMQRLERERRQQRQGQTQPRGSSTESREAQRPPEQIPATPAPRALAPPPPDPEQRGQAIPLAPPGTVTTGGTAGSRTGTFGGPAGTGTTVRDGGTTTLMGADGTIRTVPTPR